jgi:hypothetical protein
LGRIWPVYRFYVTYSFSCAFFGFRRSADPELRASLTTRCLVRRSGMNPQIILASVLLNLLAVVSASSAPTKQVVTFVSACTCKGDHHKDRWTAKTDPALPPSDKSKITAITPSQIFQWPGVGASAGITRQSNRIVSEQRWFALTGRVVDVRVEGDGDIHVALMDANGNKPGTVGVEIPPGPQWCKFRQLVLSWTDATFPFNYPTASKLKIQKNHVITATGKAFYDVDHAPNDFSNQRPKPFKPGYAVWELHPVMGLGVNQ